MSKSRKALKYSAAGAVTVLYLGSIWAARNDDLPEVMDRRKIIGIASGLIVSTWIAALA